MNTILGTPELAGLVTRRIAYELPRASHIGRVGPAMRMACVKGFGIFILNPGQISLSRIVQTVQSTCESA